MSNSFGASLEIMIACSMQRRLTYVIDSMPPTDLGTFSSRRESKTTTVVPSATADASTEEQGHRGRLEGA